MNTAGKTIKLRMKFGGLIRKYRLKLKLSQEILAEKADIHRTYVSDIEWGKVDISITVAYKLAKALNISFGRLAKEAEEAL
ncbi:MAG: helix-turn-helix transcriptional regulator [Candidatus Omnitrophica bacterium]|nr:helix-turn-helix transcriptional regulator [Candidatus Omnitrophota bacterium]